jgi:Carboxypeptidase regulatory-like domain
MSSFTRSCCHLQTAAFISSLLLATPALAQDATGAIRGTVTDAGGGRIGAATVVLVNTATNFRYSTTTNVTGRFIFDLLPPGDYSGRVESPGMSPQTTPRLHVDVGGTTELEFKLAVAGVKETVTVSGEPPLVETQPSGLSALIDERAINELPLNGRRHTDLALLTPGVTQDPRGLTSGSNGDLAFGGIRGFQSSYLVDGGDNNNGLRTPSLFFAVGTGRRLSVLAQLQDTQSGAGQRQLGARGGAPPGRGRFLHVRAWRGPDPRA